MLHDRTSLLEEKWRWSEQEELDAYVSELLYIHTKLMIVDDKRVIMGSANINDRSQKVCDGDSEIALVVEDGDMIRSTMNGKPYEVARFATTSSSASTLASSRRRRLTSAPRRRRRSCGPRQRSTRTRRAARRTGSSRTRSRSRWSSCGTKPHARTARFFTEIFRPVPTNLVRDWEAYDGYVPKVKAGHVVPGIPLEHVKKQLSDVPHRFRHHPSVPDEFWRR
ncbi:hypothetical protein B0H14DRAFT_2498500 [Mycena olivaceomarginata]|nr:hypothetical protein B0H14DRAFT_2498500 [Mycena olivaceomarginata]